jgi:tRNA U38,U39,U40 pseudouridine synthase TruA
MFGFGAAQESVSDFDYQIKHNARGPSLMSVIEGKKNQDISELQQEENESRLANSISKMPREIQQICKNLVGTRNFGAFKSAGNRPLTLGKVNFTAGSNHLDRL